MPTKTSTFGTGRRESHDATAFYSRKMSQEASPAAPKAVRQTPTASQQLDTIFCGTSEKMDMIEDGIVDLVVTSPPYNVGKDYEEDLSLDEYIDLLHNVFAECYRVMQPDGRLAINIANVGRKPYVPLSSYVDAVCTAELGFQPRAQIIWQKGEGASGSCAWGTFASAKNPVLRDIHEYILVYSKNDFGRLDVGTNTITKEAFLRDTLSVWKMQPASAKKVGHPAPFPVELPHRLIQLYTYENDIVLDPFCGAGTTCIAALAANRHYLGYEIDPDYVTLSNERIQQWKQPSSTSPTS